MSEFEESTSKFNIGDAVSVNSPDSVYDGTYMIKEVTEIDDGLSKKYMYTVCPINNEGKLYVYEESVLEYQYHDNEWEEFFIESERKDLPKWRGELYNFFMFYIDPDRVNLDLNDDLNKKLMERYKDYTIPPIRMWHILMGHSIYSRIDIVLKSESNREIISKNINVDIDDLDIFASRLQRKIRSRNLNDVGPDFESKIDVKSLPKFTNQEIQFAIEIDSRDTSAGFIKDHYPLELTNLQIMDAIKEA